MSSLMHGIDLMSLFLINLSLYETACLLVLVDLYLCFVFVQKKQKRTYNMLIN